MEAVFNATHREKTVMNLRLAAIALALTTTAGAPLHAQTAKLQSKVLMPVCYTNDKSKLSFRVDGPDNAKICGYMDQNARNVVPPVYEPHRAREFNEYGFGRSTINAKSYCIDVNGRVITPSGFSSLSCEFPNGLGRVKRNGLYGYINTSGALVIQPQFYSVGNFAEGLAKVEKEKDGKKGYINTSGTFAIEPQFDDVDEFSGGLARVQINGKYGYINTSGILVIDAKFEYTFRFSEGLSYVEIDGKCGYINTSGSFVVHPQFKGCGSFKGGLAYVYNKDYKYGYIDNKGNLITELRFDNANDFENGLASVKYNNKFGYINTKGIWVIQPQFEELGGFVGGLAVAKKDGNWGYINTKGVWVIQPQFSNANEFVGGLAEVWQGDKYFYINTKGQRMVNFDNDLARFEREWANGKQMAQAQRAAEERESEARRRSACDRFYPGKPVSLVVGEYTLLFGGGTAYDRGVVIGVSPSNGVISFKITKAAISPSAKEGTIVEVSCSDSGLQ